LCYGRKQYERGHDLEWEMCFRPQDRYIASIMIIARIKSLKRVLRTAVTVRIQVGTIAVSLFGNEWERAWKHCPFPLNK